MQRWLSVLIGMAAVNSSVLLADFEDEIAFEESDSVEEQCEEEHPCTHHHYYKYNPEEEHLWHERSDSSWPGKRDGNFIDTFIYQ